MFLLSFFQERRRRGDLMTIDGELSSDEDDGRDPRMRGKMYGTNFEDFLTNSKSNLIQLSNSQK